MDKDFGNIFSAIKTLHEENIALKSSLEENKLYLGRKNVFKDFFPYFSSLYAEQTGSFEPQIFKAQVENVRKTNYSSLNDKSILQDTNVRMTFEELQELPQGRFTLLSGSNIYECLHIANPTSKKWLFVFGGDVSSPTGLRPIPQNHLWSWVNRIGVNYVYIEDPMVVRYYRQFPPLHLGWYYDGEQNTIRKEIAILIDKIVHMRHIPKNDVFLYGLSGGGSAAIGIGALLGYGTSLSINPQLNFLEYYYSDKYQEITGVPIKEQSQLGGENDLCGKMLQAGQSNFIIAINLFSESDGIHLKHLVDTFQFKPKLGMNVITKNICLFLYSAYHHINPHSSVFNHTLFSVFFLISNIIKKSSYDLTDFEDLFCFINEMHFNEWNYIIRQRFLENMQINNIFTMLEKGRLDIVSTAKCDIICNQDNILIRKPQWIQPQDGGIGYVLELNSKDVSFQIKCSDDCDLTLIFRSTDFRNVYKERINYLIDVKDIRIDGSSVVSEELSISHDKSFRFSVSCKKGQTVSVVFKYDVHRYEYTEFRNLLSRMMAHEGV